MMGGLSRVLCTVLMPCLAAVNDYTGDNVCDSCTGSVMVQMRCIVQIENGIVVQIEMLK